MRLHFPSKERQKERIQGILQVLAGTLVLLILILSGCNAYKQIEKKPPESLRDSSRLAVRYKSTYPPEKDKKTDTVTAYIAKKSDTELLKKLADSILKLRTQAVTNIEIKYRDTCTSAKQSYGEALEVGYQQGYYKGKLAAVRDTLEIRTIITTTITDNSGIAVERNLRVAAEAEREKEKTKKERNWTAIMILSGLLVVFGVGLYFTIKKTGKLAKI